LFGASCHLGGCPPGTAKACKELLPRHTQGLGNRLLGNRCAWFMRSNSKTFDLRLRGERFGSDSSIGRWAFESDLNADEKVFSSGLVANRAHR